MMREVILTRKHAPIKVTFIGLDWMFKQVYDWYVKRHKLKPFRDLCMVCGKRKGRIVTARYRLESEVIEDDPIHNYEVLKKVRPLAICGYCIRKASMRGYFMNSRIYVDEIVDYWGVLEVEA